MTNIINRLIKSIFETKIGRIHTYPSCWVLDKYTHNTKLIKNKGIIVSGQLIKRKDSNGNNMVLIKRRGVHCPNIIYFEGRPVHETGQEKLKVCSILFSGCQKCEYHEKSSKKIRYPRCMYKSSADPTTDTLKDLNNIMTKAVETTNKILNKH
jgi:hypothetical protein